MHDITIYRFYKNKYFFMTEWKNKTIPTKKDGFMAVYKRCYIIFLIGASGYSLIEILWRGYTHPSMALLGGFCLIIIYYVNLALKHKPRFLKATSCAALITLAELFAGLILNTAMHLNVWDYSAQPMNFMGQICPLFSLFWFMLSYAVLFALEKIGKNNY